MGKASIDIRGLFPPRTGNQVNLEVNMDLSVKQIEQQGNFVTLCNRLFKLLIRWLFLYPTILIIAYEAYYWLRFAEFLDLGTYKIAPPRLVGFLYNLTRWEGANMLIFNFLQLPVFITVPIIGSIITYLVFQCALAFYYLGVDCGKAVRKIQDRNL